MYKAAPEVGSAEGKERKTALEMKKERDTFKKGLEDMESVTAVKELSPSELSVKIADKDGSTLLLTIEVGQSFQDSPIEVTKVTQEKGIQDSETIDPSMLQAHIDLEANA